MCQNQAQRGVFGQFVDGVNRGHAGAGDGDDFVNQARRGDAVLRRLRKRSMISARAAMEHKTSGMMGQPAA